MESVFTDSDWRRTMYAHDELLDVVSLDELTSEVQSRIVEIRELAGILEQRIAFDSRERLSHILVNLNSASLHLDDVDGC